MSEAAEVKLPKVDANTLALVKALVQEMNAPTEAEAKKIASDLENSRQAGLRALEMQKRQDAFKKVCPHQQNNNKDRNKSALVYVRDGKGRAQYDFIICQQCQSVFFQSHPKWNEFIFQAQTNDNL